MTIYLDCNSTTPPEPSVVRIVQHFMEKDFGNAASPIHDYGTFARAAVEHARGQVAAVVEARRDEVIFTSGATEANNMALLGLMRHGRETGRRHVLATSIEHKSVLEPLEAMSRQGFEVELLSVGSSGRLDPRHVSDALRPDTLLVSTMQVNNETGVVQPLSEIASLLEGHEGFWHVDAAQGFGKEVESLRHPRIDLISLSGHKIYGPKGIGALVARRRHGHLPPLEPLTFGGGQEQGLRPGTLAVPLIAGLGEAAKLALRTHRERAELCRAYREGVLRAFAPLDPHLNGDPHHVLPHTVNLSIPGVEARKAIAALKPWIAVSATSACTADSVEPSHVLSALGLSPERVRNAFRISWCHLTPPANWEAVVSVLKDLKGVGA